MIGQHQAPLSIEAPVEFITNPSPEHLAFVQERAESATVRAALRSTMERQEKDILTGLFRWDLFVEEYPVFLKRAEFVGNRIALAYIDADALKETNDTLGHAEGDRYIQTIAQGVHKFALARDRAYRKGGDELILLAAVGKVADDHVNELALGIKGRLGAVIDTELESAGLKGFAVTKIRRASIGVSISEPGETPDQLLKRADEAMYEDKNGVKSKNPAYALTGKDTSTSVPLPG